MDPFLVGFSRCVGHLVIEWLRVCLLATVVVFVDSNWKQLLAVIAIQNGYVTIQMVLLRALTFRGRVHGWINVFTFLLTSYV